ncbi:MAG TPA: hypothetical protein DCE14_04600 [Kosmotogaceae bacterium]|nr:MAG: Pyridoxamine 5'-phosphate oxidase-related FMN-binding protein [Thermotogales bacterium 46_20]HAA85617.1 hypothetical protein [Kosmotogaceae bacterium]
MVIAYDSDIVRARINNEELSFERHHVPVDFKEWQLKTRLKGLKVFIGEEKGAPNFSPHSVVMSTWSPATDFPVNSCIKGLGMVPRPSLLPELYERIKQLISRSYDEGPQNTFKERVSFLLDLYSNLSNFDDTILSSIEMFKKRTYENILKDCRSTLLFYDYTTGYSVMLNVVSELVQRGDPFYNYVTAIHDLFHLPKDRSTRTDRYDFAYRFHLVEGFDKTPGPNASQQIF